MLDFTSSLYLGMTHPSGALAPWSSLTTGKPAVMASAPCTARVEHELAALQGCERATLGTSTLHLVWDLFGMLANEGTSVHVDGGTYAVARWGVERARGRGAAVGTFAHHDAADLRRSIARLGAGMRPVVATDGFCPSCGDFAPLADYVREVSAGGGIVVVDDTQALGVFGIPTPGAPYGSLGGGSLRRLQAGGDGVLVVASLAKGFGAPVAVLSGSHEAIAFFLARSSTRVHSSPPSSSAVLAAARALRCNEGHGDALRTRLAENVRRLRLRLRAAGVALRPGPFAVARVEPVPGVEASALHRGLADRGVRTVVLASCRGGPPEVAFAVRADHEPRHIDRAAAALLSACGWNRKARDRSRVHCC